MLFVLSVTNRNILVVVRTISVLFGTQLTLIFPLNEQDTNAVISVDAIA